MNFKLVTRYTRAGCKGKVMKCPNCGFTHRAYSFSWKDLGCPSCNALIGKYKWLVQESDSRIKSAPPTPHEALVVGFTVYVTSNSDDAWLSFYYMHHSNEVAVTSGYGNMANGRDFMPLEKALNELKRYEDDEQEWRVEVKT